MSSTSTQHNRNRTATNATIVALQTAEDIALSTLNNPHSNIIDDASSWWIGGDLSFNNISNRRDSINNLLSNNKSMDDSFNMLDLDFEPLPLTATPDTTSSFSCLDALLNKSISNTTTQMNKMMKVNDTYLPSLPFYNNDSSLKSLFPSTVQQSSMTMTPTPVVSVSPISLPAKVTSNNVPTQQPQVAVMMKSKQQQQEQEVRQQRRSRKLQPEIWMERYKELIQFRSKHGHLLVPNHYKSNPQLSQWVKRNRYQYKLKHAGKHSTLTNEREEILNKIGFIWDSHAIQWQQRFLQLKQYQQIHGHTNVPSTYSDENGVDIGSSLSLWCKHQRRQYNRLQKGLSSTMTMERYTALQSIQFNWNPRNLTK